LIPVFIIHVSTLELFGLQIIFLLCRSMNFIVSNANAIAKSSSVHPTGKIQNVRIAARRNYPKNFRRLPPPALVKIQPPKKTAVGTVAAARAVVIEVLLKC
jgi:hypothetical protein